MLAGQQKCFGPGVYLQTKYQVEIFYDKKTLEKHQIVFFQNFKDNINVLIPF